MAYLIFNKGLDNLEGTLYSIAETQIDLDNLNIIKTDYKIIEINIDDFNLIKKNTKNVLKYINNEVFYSDSQVTFENKIQLKNYVNSFLIKIKKFTENNSNHPHLSKWNNYYNQLDNLDLNSINYPLNKSLEQYLSDLGQPFLNILQIP